MGRVYLNLFRLNNVMYVFSYDIWYYVLVIRKKGKDNYDINFSYDYLYSIGCYWSSINKKILSLFEWGIFWLN